MFSHFVLPESSRTLLKAVALPTKLASPAMRNESIKQAITVK